MTTTPQKHSFATRIFHHGTLIFMIVLWGLIKFQDDIEGAIGIHKALGALFVLWVVARLINRVIAKKVPYATVAPKWQTGLAHLVHFGLYACMLAMPIAGILMSVYGGRAVNIFGIVQIPALKPDREMSEFFANLHTDVIFPLLIALVLAHVGGALYHQFVLKDGLLKRMR